MDNISDLLKSIKAKSNLSEIDLAKEIKVSQPTVHRILNGQTQCLSSTYMNIVELHKRICSK
ncbi:helix-turn-helix domain-containing protein [Undibacterium macrobrachii]|uniref:HTH cro/C1-type domain-containing protein n=1 Tax=Undibacterium macrobrachii TaxID=1119058 RepID=A0ABQ2X6F6_9BURK|nr:hypothetical protein GCM10011282_04350 [Undibacterium macrobrachii]